MSLVRLNAAGLPPLSDLIDVERAQVSLDTYEVAYLLDLKQPIEFSDFLARKTACEKASRRLGLQKTQSFLTDVDLARLHERFDESNRRLIVVLGRQNNPPPLQLDVRANSDSYCDLRQLRASESYARFREVADAIYLRRTRRSWLSFGSAR